MSIDASTVYVYYKVRADDAPALIAAWRDLHAGWHAAMPSLTAALNQSSRLDSPGLLTLMESYAWPAGSNPVWRDQVEVEAQQRLGSWIVGERHVEVFVPCA